MIFRMVQIFVLAGMGLFLPQWAEAVEFNTNIIDAKDRDNIDLSRFEVNDYTPPGNYLLDVFINGRLLPDSDLITYLPVDEGKSSRVCLSPELVDLFGLSPAVRESLTLWHDGKCVGYVGKGCW